MLPGFRPDLRELIDEVVRPSALRPSCQARAPRTRPTTAPSYAPAPRPRRCRAAAPSRRDRAFAQPAAITAVSAIGSIACLFMPRILAYYAEREAHPTVDRGLRAAVGGGDRHQRAAWQPDAHRSARHQGRPPHDHRAADRLHRDSRGSRRDCRCRCARRRTGKRRNGSAETGESRSAGLRDQPLGRQRVRPRQPHRRHAVSRREEHRLQGVRLDQRADRSRRQPHRSQRRQQSENPADRGLRLSRGSGRVDRAGVRGQRRRRAGATDRQERGFAAAR